MTNKQSLGEWIRSNPQLFENKTSEYWTKKVDNILGSDLFDEDVVDLSDITDETQLSSLTVGQFKAIIKDVVRKELAFPKYSEDTNAISRMTYVPKISDNTLIC